MEIYAREWKFQQRLIDGVAILGVGIAGNCEAPDVANSPSFGAGFTVNFWAMPIVINLLLTLIYNRMGRIY